jgi:hypothetical protein
MINKRKLAPDGNELGMLLLLLLPADDDDEVRLCKTGRTRTTPMTWRPDSFLVF